VGIYSISPFGEKTGGSQPGRLWPLVCIGSGCFFSFRLYLVRERFEKYPDGRRKLHGKEKSSPVNGTWDIVRYGI